MKKTTFPQVKISTNINGYTVRVYKDSDEATPVYFNPGKDAYVVNSKKELYKLLDDILK